MAGGSTPPGWYAAEGDPPGTQRWWDGTQWVGEPQPIPTAPPTVESSPSSMPLLPGSGAGPQDGAPPLPPSSSFPSAPMPAPAGHAVGMYPEASQATLGLVLAIVGFFCGVTAPFGLWFGWKERQAIDEGRRDPANRGQAIAAMVIGGITTALFIVAVGFFLLIVILASASSAASLNF